MFIINSVIVLHLTESKLDHHRGGLRSYRYIRTHRPSGAWLQRDRDRTATLERHVSQSPPTHRTVAHSTRNARKELELVTPSILWTFLLVSLLSSLLLRCYSTCVIYTDQKVI